MMDVSKFVSLTFLWCQIAPLLASPTLGPVFNETGSCINCGPSTSTSPTIFDSVTSEEIRKEILRWEREKILKQLRQTDEVDSSFRRVEKERRQTRSVGPFVPDTLAGLAESNLTAAKEAWVEEFLDTAIIMGQMVKRGSTTNFQCLDETYNSKAATCINFPNKTDIKWDRFRYATLRFLLGEGSVSKGNHTFAVAAINPGRGNSQFAFNITLQIDNADINNYIPVDVTQLFRQAMSNTQIDRDLSCSVTLRVTCLTCGNLARSPISVDSTRLPFLVVGFNSRKRRASPDCDMIGDYLVKDTNRAGCCMVPILVNFHDMGMDYVIFPPRYLTHYCSGRCYHFTTRTYSAILQNVINKKLRKDGQGEQFAVCCVPQVISNLPIVYKNESGTVMTSNLKDMVVNSCGC